MTGIITDEANKILNGYFSDTQYTTPNNLYIGLFVADPTTNNNAEASYQGYNRIPLQNKMGNASNGIVTNIEQIIFDEVDNDTNEIYSYFAICSTDTVGDDNFIFIGELQEDITVQQNYTVVFEVSTIKVSII